MTPDLSVDGLKPICNGVHFDDVERFPRDALLRAIAEGYVFATEFAAAGRRYGGTIVAVSEAMAAEIAGMRGLGETVLGPLVRTETWRPQ